MAQNATIRPQQIERARQKNTPGGGGTAGEGFQKAKEKGYNSRELSQMLKNEGIIIPAYLIK